MPSFGELSRRQIIARCTAAGLAVTASRLGAAGIERKMLARPFVDPLVDGIDFRSALNGRSYEVRIGLPVGYRAGKSSYPVLVVLDAEYAFGTTHEATRLEAMWSRRPFRKAKPIPEFIVVGITMPDRDENPTRRNFEYMPTPDRRETGAAGGKSGGGAGSNTNGAFSTGGAPVFLDVLTKEILPLIESQYRVDRSTRILAGQSAGGAFCCYTLFTKPETFTNYIIVSPGIVDGAVFGLEAAWAATHKDLKADVFLSVGEGELADPLTIVSNTTRLAEQLNVRNYPGLRLTTWVVPDASHAETATPSLARALNAFVK